MDITRTDLTIIVAMSIGIILMSFIFPAAGLTGDKAQQSEIPDFNITSDRFDFAGDFPNDPGTPTRGTLHQQIGETGELQDSVDLFRKDGHTIRLRQTGYGPGTQSDQVVVNLTYINATGVIVEDEGTIWTNDQEGDRRTLGGTDFFGLEVSVVPEFEFNVSQGETGVWHVDWRIENELESDPTGGSDSGGSWLSRIPVVGGALSNAVSTAGDVASVVGWIGSILWWLAATVFEVILNALGIVVDVLLFIFGLASYLVTTYNGAVQGAPSAWAQVILLIPGLILMLEWAKVAIVMVDVVWIG